MKKVLIVDDSALMRRVLSDIINDDEQLIVEKTANNGLEALNVLQGGCRPDILLVDINMPKMDGVQLLKELNKYRIKIPVLIVSSIASQSADETIEALALGAFDFVKKPQTMCSTEQETSDSKKISAHGFNPPLAGLSFSDKIRFPCASSMTSNCLPPCAI